MDGCAHEVVISRSTFARASNNNIGLEHRHEAVRSSTFVGLSSSSSKDTKLCRAYLHQTLCRKCSRLDSLPSSFEPLEPQLLSHSEDQAQYQLTAQTTFPESLSSAQCAFPDTYSGNPYFSDHWPKAASAVTARCSLTR